MTGLTIIPGQRVEHVILGWRGYVQSVESGSPRMVHVRTDNGERESAPEVALKRLPGTQANPQHGRRGISA